MKKISTLIFISLLSICLAISQPPQGRGGNVSTEESAKKTTEWMTKELNLTQEQIAPVDSVNLLFAKVRQAYFQAVDGDRSKIRDAMETLEKERQASLSKIFTPEQLELYKKKVQEMKNNVEHKRGRQK